MCAHRSRLTDEERAARRAEKDRRVNELHKLRHGAEPKIKDRILQLGNKGVPVEGIMARVGVTKATVYKTLRKAGITRTHAEKHSTTDFRQHGVHVVTGNRDGQGSNRRNIRHMQSSEESCRMSENKRVDRGNHPNSGRERRFRVSLISDTKLKKKVIQASRLRWLKASHARFLERHGADSAQDPE